MTAEHPSTAPPRAQIQLREPEIYRDTLPGRHEVGLTQPEISEFKQRGFLVKRGLIDDSKGLERIVDYMWQHVPRGVMLCDEPATWLDKPHRKWTEEDTKRVGALSRGNWKMRSRGDSGIGTEPFLVELTTNHPNVRAVAEQLIGPPVRRARRVRGIYSVLPRPPAVGGRLGPHADRQASQLGCMVLANDAPPRCGGFTIWPGSHLSLHPHWDTTQGSTISESRRDGFLSARDAVLRSVTPVEFAGNAGDVVFWHPRLLHSAGVNDSLIDGNEPIVRVVVPCDFQKAGRSYNDDDVVGPGAREQWWVDTRNFCEDVAATPDNIWADWAI